MDIFLIERGNGGEMVIQGNDLQTITGYENQPYLAMCGGSDWFGNTLFFDDETARFNSQTEAALINNTLTSAGRVVIENAIKADLQYLIDNAPNTTITVTTQIVSDSRLDILVNIDGQQFAYMWNPNTQEFKTI